MRVTIAVGGVMLLPLACDWEEFHACEGDECSTLTAVGGTGGTSAQGGASGGGSGGSDGSVGTDWAGTAGQGGSASGSGGSNMTDGADGGAGGDGGVPTGSGGAAGEGGSPPMCDAELLPGDDACVVSEELGVFVAPGGDDEAGDGTREAPYATLQKAANVAGQEGKRVYACATGGDYAAGLSLSEDHDGLELFGSFDCSDWSHAGELRAHVTAEVGVPLQVRDISTTLVLEGFAFESADATERGASSIAAEVRTSAGVVLRNVALRAGAGAEGDLGERIGFTHPATSELDGADGTADEGGSMGLVECPAGDVTRGGSGGWSDPAEAGADGSPDHEGSGGEGGVVGASCVGQEGRDGPEGADGPGASTRGALVNGSWVPTSGSRGGHGLAGQGGGGGASGETGGGGSGGAGGCGREGGTPGGGGGASIALFLLDAEVTLIDSEVVAGDAGDGAPGGLGERQSSVFGSPGAGFSDGCDGGRGGLGGGGGGGGGGAGGISVGILFQGTAPVRVNTDAMAGVEGEGGLGGGADNDGIAGFSEPEFDLAEL